LETLDESGSDARHRRAKSGSHFPTKQRSEQTPQSVPVLTVHRDEPARHARSQDATLDRAFATGRLIFENLTDGGGIAHHRNPCKRKSASTIGSSKCAPWSSIRADWSARSSTTPTDRAAVVAVSAPAVESQRGNGMHGYDFQKQTYPIVPA